MTLLGKLIDNVEISSGVCRYDSSKNIGSTIENEEKKSVYPETLPDYCEKSI
jgi:hypothetical protein